MSDGYGRRLWVGLLGLAVSLLIVAGLTSVAAAESIMVQDTLDVDNWGKYHASTHIEGGYDFGNQSWSDGMVYKTFNVPARITRVWLDVYVANNTGSQSFTLRMQPPGGAYSLVGWLEATIPGRLEFEVIGDYGPGDVGVKIEVGGATLDEIVELREVTFLGDILEAPGNLTASAGDAQVSLSWGAVAGATGYKVKRSTTAGGPYEIIASGVIGTDYLDTGLSNGTTYYYVVSAVHSSGESANSNETSATARANAPAAPQNLRASAGDARVSLTWTAIVGASTYTVKRGTMAGGPYREVATGITDTIYVDTPLTNGITYYYVVSAVNQSGEGPNSNEASVTPTAPQQGGGAILSIALSNGMEKEYDLTMTAVRQFISWYEQRASGAGLPYYAFDKTYNRGPFASRKDYIAHEKIIFFEISEYGGE